MSRTALDFEDTWFTPEELAQLRRRMPFTYINAVPVKLASDGSLERVGLLLRSLDDGTLGRELVGGRVRFHETIRDALIRLTETDLGPMALPQVPAAMQPFTVAEYFPTEGVSRLHDPRQHAIALCFILPVQGECSPRQDALSLDWLTPDEACREDILSEMRHGQEHVLRQALAFLGALPS